MPQSIALSQVLPILGAIVAFLFAALLVLYIFRLLFGQRIRAPGARNRPRRLDIVDAFDLGRDRQLIIVRRDNVEHLLMIGGPNDVLVEGAIARSEAREQRPAPARERESAPQQPAGWPAAPTAPAPAPQPLAAQAANIGDTIRRRPEPSPSPQAPPSAQPLPSDVFAPSAPARPAAPPPAPEAPPASRLAGLGSAPPLRPAPSAPQPGQSPPASSRQPAPPFLARTQRPGAAAAPTKRDAQQPAPAPTPAASTSPQEPVAPRENAPPPVQSPPAQDASNPLESLEAEMARLLGRPDPEK